MTGTLRLGDIAIDRIVESEAPFELASSFLPGLTEERLAENRHWLRPSALDERDHLILCIQSYVVRTPHHTILVDTCIGNDKPRPGRPMLDRITHSNWMNGLAALGLTVNDIDIVMCTHLHVDHVGWNTRLDNGRWVPTFPKARYLFSEKEFVFWKAGKREEPDSAFRGFGLARCSSQYAPHGNQQPGIRRSCPADADPRPYPGSLRRGAGQGT